MPRKKMQAMLINWSLAKCSCPSWSATTDESALRITLASLDDCKSSLHWWLGFFTVWVVVGVALELVFVVWEYVDELHDFRRGIVHPPDRPNRFLFALGFFAAGLVALGVGGELYAESKIATVETCIRKGDDALFLLLSKEAGDAKERAAVLEKGAAQLREEAALIELSLAWRSLTSTNEKLLVHRLSSFPEQQFWVWYNAGDAEGHAFAWEIAGALHKAGLKVFDPAGTQVFSPAGIPFNIADSYKTTGLVVASRDTPRSRDAAKVLVKALADCGFDVTLNLNFPKGKLALSQQNELSVNVETKPKGPQGEAKLRLEEAKKKKTQSSPSTH